MCGSVCVLCLDTTIEMSTMSVGKTYTHCTLMGCLTWCCRSKCSGMIATACSDNMLRIFKEVSVTKP